MQDPSIPVHKKGVLTSFLDGKSIPIPEKDTVMHVYLNTIHDAGIEFLLCLTSSENVGR